MVAAAATATTTNFHISICKQLAQSNLVKQHSTKRIKQTTAAILVLQNK
jgi:hypothetical protein